MYRREKNGSFTFHKEENKKKRLDFDYDERKATRAAKLMGKVFNGDFLLWLKKNDTTTIYYIYLFIIYDKRKKRIVR